VFASGGATAGFESVVLFTYFITWERAQVLIARLQQAEPFSESKLIPSTKVFLRNVFFLNKRHLENIVLSIPEFPFHFHEDKNFTSFPFYPKVKKPKAILSLLLILIVGKGACQTMPTELYLAAPVDGNANQGFIDSLQKKLPTQAEDTLKVIMYNQLAMASDSDSGLHFGQKALRLAAELNYKRGKARAYASIAACYGTYRKNEMDSAFRYFKKAEDYAIKNGLYEETHEFIGGLLNLCFYIGDFSQAMTWCTRGMQLAEQNSDMGKIIQYNNLLGFIYLRQGDVTAARKFYQHYFTLSASANDSLKMADAQIGLAEVFLAEQQPAKALPLLHQSWQYLERKVSRHLRTFSKSEKVPYNLFTTAKAHRMMGHYKIALDYCLRGFQYSRFWQFNQYDLAHYYLITALLYNDLGHYPQAIVVMHKGLSVSKKIKHKENIRDAYEGLSKIYSSIKRYDSAYYYQLLYTQVKEMIVNENSRRAIEEIQAQYELEKKDQQIILMQEEATQQKLMRNAAIGSALLILAMVYLVFSRNRQRQKTKFQEELNRKQNDLFQAVAVAQDKERKRIAQDIHDQVGSLLSAAKLQLTGVGELRRVFSDDEKQKYSKALSLIDQAAEELRHIAHNLMPATLSRLGLVTALKNLSKKIAKHAGFQIHFSVHGLEERLKETTEVSIYPIVLELINNIVKHARATSVTVQLTRHPDHINILVEDDGVGFRPESRTQANGIGLANLKSRVEYLAGTFYIDSTPGQGTIVTIDIPYS
jgi:two-component system, NarL family, sensor kinase